MNDPTQLSIYQFRAVLNGVSPMVWRRFLLASETSLADLHKVLQLAGCNRLSSIRARRMTGLPPEFNIALGKLAAAIGEIDKIQWWHSGRYSVKDLAP